MENTENFTPSSADGIDTGRVATRKLDDAANSVHRVIDKASDAARPAVDQLAAGAHQAVNSFTTAASQAAETIEAKRTQLMDAQAQFAESCRAQIRREPLTSIGIALTAGFLVSWLMRRL